MSAFAFSNYLNQLIRFFLLIFFIAQACNHDMIRIKISDKKEIEKIPSGSGIIKLGDGYYIIGDDSPFLYALNSDLELTSKIRIFDDLNFLESKRIPKSEKPDFEAMEMIGGNEIVVFGSGSKSPQRNIFIRIIIKDTIVIEKYEISKFYKSLKNLGVLIDSELNIEATAFYNNKIFLFNRKKNLILQFEYLDLLDHLQGKTEFPQPEIRHFTLPKINGVEAGFSGATALRNEPKIIFTASVEDTDNAYDDGEVLGSYIGMIDISLNNISESFDYCRIPSEGVYLKVESVSIEKEVSPRNTKIVLITDDDKGNSILLKSTLKW